MRKISELLKEARIEKKLTLELVSKQTKIRKEYLVAMEDGRYHDMPSESYALGFIKNYATFLGINKDKAAALFRREYEAKTSRMLPAFKSKDAKIHKRVLLTPKSIVAAIIFLVIVGYVGFQYSSIFFGPSLEVEKPTANQVVEENIVEVSGKTDPYATVTIDNEEVYVRLDGTFEKNLYLFEGERQITIVSKNRSGKETKETIPVRVR